MIPEGGALKTLIFIVFLVCRFVFLPANQGEIEKQIDTVNPELGKYLRGAAAYCEKLKKSAFHFICRETVADTLREFNTYGDVIEQVKVRRFDYQLLHVNNRVNEQRLPIEKKLPGQERNSMKNPVFSFFNERAVFAPGTLLAKERQTLFRYEIIKYRKHNDREFAVIHVIPRKPGTFFFSSGEVWLDMENYSVRRISVVPRYIHGYEKLIERAQIFKTRLFLNCEIDFNHEYKRLYFPTEVSIVETYQGGPIITRVTGIRGLEHTRTVFSYLDYRFFNVETDVRYE